MIGAIQSIITPTILGGRAGSLPAPIYLLENRVLDLGSLEDYTIPDKSAEGNTAVLFTGRYITTDGVSDSAINVDLSSAPRVAYAKVLVRSAEVLFALGYYDMTFSYFWGSAAGSDWEEQTLLRYDVGGVGSQNGLTLGLQTGSYKSGDWSNLRLYDEDDNLIAHWPLNEHADIDGNGLNGLPCFDVSGNGYHGEHVGCSAGTGEGNMLKVANLPESTPWFDGSTSYIDTGIATAQSTTTEEFEFVYYKTENEAPKYDEFAFGDSGGRIGFGWSGNNLLIECAGSGHRTTSGEYVTYNKPTKLKYIINVGVSTEFWVDDVLVDIKGGLSPTVSPHSYNLGTARINSEKFAGMILSAKYTRDGVVIWDQSDGGTSMGTFLTLDQKRQTIPQTALSNFNYGKNLIKDTTFLPSDNGLWEDTGLVFTAGYGANPIDGEINTVRVDVPSDNGRIFANTGAAVAGVEYTVSFYIRDLDGDTGAEVDIRLESPSSAFLYRQPVTSQWQRLSWTYTSGGETSIRFPHFNNSGSYEIYAPQIEIGDTVTDFEKNTSGFALANVLIPASDANSSVDIFGNDIKYPRANEDVINLVGDGYVEIVDSESLDITTTGTWELWGNFYGNVTDNYSVLMSKYSTYNNQRSWHISKRSIYDADKIEFNVSPDGLSNTGNSVVVQGIPNEYGCLHITKDGATHKAYFNGVALTTIGVTGNSCHVGTASVLIGAMTGASGDKEWLTEYPIGSVKIYDTTLTPEEVLNNFNAQKSKYKI